MPTYLSDAAMNELCDAIADSPAYCDDFKLLPDPITGFVERYQVEFELGAMLDIWRNSAREVIEQGQIEVLREKGEHSVAAPL